MWAAEKLAIIFGLSLAGSANGLSSPARAINVASKEGHFLESWHAIEGEEHVGVQLGLAALSDFRKGVRRGITGHLSVDDVNETAGNWDYRKAPPESQGEYFRPVSTTVYCVMILTIESLCIYTALALARNADELDGRTEPSLLTDTLATAARSIAYPPMMCMLFVACRMYVLATTEGLGEPQPWAKQAMYVATAGMSGQFFVCLTLPFFTRQHGKESFSSRAGENHDAHPLLKRHHFLNFGCKLLFWLLQMGCMVALYGGVFTVMYAIRTYPEGTTKVSAAVRCTVMISVLFFSVFLLLWLVRTLKEDFLQPLADEEGEALEEDPDHPGWQRPKKDASESSSSKNSGEQESGGTLGASLQMSFVVRKGPMLAVLFLACRMRALQLDPPHGMPPPWAQMCFFVLTGALLAETLAAAIVGFTGRTSIGYYGTEIFQSSPAAHGLQYAIAFVIFCGLFPVYNAAIMMTDKDGKEVPLSTTVKCVFYFAALFFGIDFLKWIALFFQNVFRWSLEGTVQTFTSASIGVSFAPLLCILFVACRMRALQITQQQGSPQEWAQNCMFVCVFVTVLQMFCCLILPLFTRGASHVDPEGNVVYDLTPMIGAYCVTIVKYVSLFCLHGAVFAICTSIFLITPETAAPHGPPSFNMESLMKMCLIAMVVILIAMLMSSAKVIGLAVKFAIESADDTLLGVQITVGSAALAICRGYVNVSDVIVNNPEGKADEFGVVEEKHWNTEYLAKIDKLVVKINMGRLICTMGKEFEITTMQLEGVQVNFDKPSLFGDASNVQEILDHLDKLTNGGVTDDCLDAEQKAAKEKKSAEAAEAAKKAAEEAAAKKAEEEKKKQEELERLKAEGKEPPPEESMPDIIIHEVNISNIGCACVIKGIPMRAVVGDIKFEDFMQELEKHGDSNASKGGAMMAIVISILMRTLMKNVMVNVTPLLRGAVAGAGKAALVNSVGSAGSACKSIFGMLRRKLTGSPQPALGEAVKTDR